LFETQKSYLDFLVIFSAIFVGMKTKSLWKRQPKRVLVTLPQPDFFETPEITKRFSFVL